MQFPKVVDKMQYSEPIYTGNTTGEVDLSTWTLTS